MSALLLGVAKLKGHPKFVVRAEAHLGFRRRHAFPAGVEEAHDVQARKLLAWGGLPCGTELSELIAARLSKRLERIRFPRPS